MRDHERREEWLNKYKKKQQQQQQQHKLGGESLNRLNVQQSCLWIMQAFF